MWILNWIPDAIFHILLVVGVMAVIASWILNFIPFVKTYSLPIQVIGFLLTIFAVWHEGGISKDVEWKKRVAEVELKLAEAEAKSEKVNTKIITKVVTKKQIVKEKAEVITKYIDREVIINDNQCIILPATIIAHDAAAQNKAPADIIKEHDKLTVPKEKKKWQDYGKK